MLVLLAALFIAVPLAELYVIIEVGRLLGAAETIVLLLVISFAGAWLARRQGLSVLGRLRARLEAGELPGREIVDGVLVLVAAVLLLTPGFLTDAVALLLLVPVVRAGVRALLLRRWQRRLDLGNATIRVASSVRTARRNARSSPDDEAFPHDDEPPALPPG